jgi:hypothetical protein
MSNEEDRREEVRRSIVQAIVDTRGVPYDESKKVWRHPLFVLMTGGLLTVAFALVCVTAALWAVNGSRVDTNEQLQCTRSFAIATSEAQASELAAIGRAQAVTLEALAASATDDDETFAKMVAQVPMIIESLTKTAQALENAINAQRAAINSCG